MMCKMIHLIMVNCIMHTNQMIAKMKQDTNAKTSIFPWLCSNRVYIIVNTLGHHVIRTIGNLANIHPCITNQMTLCDDLAYALQNVKFSPDKVIALTPEAASHYSQAKDSGDHVATFIPPFKNFPMISIASLMTHSKLLSKLLTRLFREPPNTLPMLNSYPEASLWQLAMKHTATSWITTIVSWPTEHPSLLKTFIHQLSILP